VLEKLYKTNQITYIIGALWQREIWFSKNYFKNWF